MIAYRDAAPADAPLLANLSGRSFALTFGHLYREEDLRPFLERLNADGWHGELVDSRYQVRLALDEGEAVGFCKIGPLTLPVDPAAPAIELRQLYLLPDWQGRGVAQALMDWALGEARRRGAREVYLSVFTKNYRAQAFYRRYGFGFVAPYKFMVGEQADEDEIWKLELT
jgi:ribosomal protein S18 acetylase RimI-like enzyme